MSPAQTAPREGNALTEPPDEGRQYVRLVEHAAPQTSSDTARASTPATMPSAPPAPAAAASPVLPPSHNPITKTAVADNRPAAQPSEPRTSQPAEPGQATPNPSPKRAAVKSAAPQSATEPPSDGELSVAALPLNIESAPAPTQKAASPVAAPASGVETKPELARGASDMSASTPTAPSVAAAPPDVPTQRADGSSASFKTSSPAAPTLSSTTTPKAPLVPRSENLAFAVRMLGLTNARSQSPVTEARTPVTSNEGEPAPVAEAKAPAQQSKPSDLPQPTPAPRNEAPSEPQRETKSEPPETPQSDVNGLSQPTLHNPQQPAGAATNLPAANWNETSAQQSSQASPVASAGQSTEIAHANLPGATQASRLLTTDLPKTSTSSEILLHLTGNDQTAAAIRVADRAGSVNVSVHAADPVLRESLRSNLGELSTQLNLQGWKADVVKTAAVAAHSDGQQESHAGGERGSQQQQSAGANRQPQRDRRSNSGQWRQEFDQQITSGNAHSGGNR